MIRPNSALVETGPSIEVLSDNAIKWREQNGLLVPMHYGNGLQVAGCGDERSWTEMFNRIISQLNFDNGQIDIDHFNDVYHSSKDENSLDPSDILSPGRCMGGVNGVTMDLILFTLLDKGKDGLRDLFKKDGPYTIKDVVGLAAEISTRANRLERGPILVCHHSSDTNEGNGGKLSIRKCCRDAIGCAFAHNFSNIIFNVASDDTTLVKAKRVSDLDQEDLALDDVVQSYRELTTLLDGEISVNRSIIRHYQRNKLFVPVEMHAKDHFKNTASAMIIDNAGYRSNAQLNIEKLMPRYHHSLMLSHYILSKTHPEFVKSDSLSVFKAISLMAAMATHGALNGMNKGKLRIEVIPGDYSADLHRAA